MKLHAISLLFFTLLTFNVMTEENQQSQLTQGLPTDQQPLGLYGANIEIQRQVFGLGSSSKRTWPELVGLPGEEAEKKIRKEMPTARIQVVMPDYFVTMDYNIRRVRIHVDSYGKVIKPPTIG